MEYEFGDVVTHEGERHLVLGVAHMRFRVDDLWVKEDEDTSMDVTPGNVVLIQISGHYLGYIDASSPLNLELENKKED